ncbi:MAG: hypothetical protein D6748_08065 [Calditrichaeota bacterium]|nr:MAG: hypothetical protein D6748_08065 [Calditrichota bacterium]
MSEKKKKKNLGNYSINLLRIMETNKTNQPVIMAMHQPNYIPWLGYFHKMANCDIFVYLDAVQFPRGRSFAARNRIKTANGVTYLTIPLQHPSGNEGKATYLEMKFADEKWKTKHLRTIQMNYKRAPYFQEIYSIYEQCLMNYHDFVELNIGLIEAFGNYLGITSQRKRLSQILKNFGQKSQLIVDICQAVGANIYLSGTGGGREYNDENLLQANGIELRYDTFTHPTYPQLWGDFEPNLSILDVLFNCGPRTREFIKH